MTTEPDAHAAPADRTLAGEYVLGVLGAAERAEVARRVERDAAFAALIETWQEQLLPLADAVPPVPPPARVWSGLAAGLFGDGGRKPGLLASLGFWRWASAGAAAVAVASLVFAAALVLRPEPAPLVASLQAGDAGPVFLVRFDAGRGRLSVRPGAAAGAPGTVPELWVIDAAGTPRSLGVIADDGRRDLDVPPDLAAALLTEATLAVSREPVGGSPTGLPTGPVVALGTLQHI
jgi:anti-sigma-K factor RskA